MSGRLQLRPFAPHDHDLITPKIIPCKPAVPKLAYHSAFGPQFIIPQTWPVRLHALPFQAKQDFQIRYQSSFLFFPSLFFLSLSFSCLSGGLWGLGLMNWLWGAYLAFMKKKNIHYCDMNISAAFPPPLPPFSSHSSAPFHSFS